MFADRIYQSILPMGILILLTLTSFWLKGIVDRPARDMSSKLRHDPDLVATHFVSHRLGANGKLAQTLSAETMRHFPDDDSSQYEVVMLKSYETNKPVTTITGDTAERLKDNETIFFNGHVVVSRDPEGKDPESWILRSDSLEVYPNQKQGRSTTPVTVTHGHDHLEAQAMAFDYNLSQVEFERARTFYAPRPR